MDNQEMILRSPDGKQRVEIERIDGSLDSRFDPRMYDPRDEVNLGHLYIKTLFDSKGEPNELGDDYAKFVKAGNHLALFLFEIDKIALVKLPIFAQLLDDGKAVIKTEEFLPMCEFAGYIFTTKDGVSKAENEDGESYTLDDQKAVLEQEVKTYNDFLAGDIWCYILRDVIPDKEGDYSRMNRCVGGFIGDGAIDTILENIGAKDWIIESQEIEEESLGR